MEHHPPMRVRSPLLDGNRWRLYMPPSFELPPIHRWQLLQERKYSRLLLEPAPGDRLAKLVRPRSLPRDMLRKYVHCQAKREWQAATILRGLGIQAPRVHAFGFTLAPHATFESLAIMDYLEGYPPLRDLFQTLDDNHRRELILARVAADLGRLFAHGYRHKDPHLENLLLDRYDRPVWIDNELRRCRRHRDLQAALVKAVALLRRSARARVTDAEWRGFRLRLLQALDQNASCDHDRGYR